MQKIKIIKCAYCLHEEFDNARWYRKDDLDKHIFSQHPNHDYRNIDEVLGSWRMCGILEEREIDVK